MPHTYGGRESDQLDRIEAKLDALLASLGVAVSVPDDAVGSVTVETVDVEDADAMKGKPGKPGVDPKVGWNS